MATKRPYLVLSGARAAVAQRRRGGAAFGRVLGGAGLVVVLVTAALCWRGVSGVASVTAFSWIAAVLLAAVVGLVVARRRDADLRAAAVEVEAARGAGGAVVAATWLHTTGHEARFGPLVMRDADRACSGARLRGGAPWVANGLLLALGCLFLSVLLLATSWVPPARGLVERAFSMGVADHEGAERGDDAVPSSTVDLSELARLEVRTDRAIYLLDEPIILTVLLRADAGIEEDVPLDVVVGFTNGLPSPDVGFGTGMRVVKPDFALHLPARSKDGEEEKPVIYGQLDLKPVLERSGIHDLGLFTVEAFARPRSEDLVSGGVRSNELTFQIGPNRSRQQVQKPQPVSRHRAPKTRPTEKPKKKPGQGRQGPGKGKLGQRDRLPEARLKAQVTRPLLADGPQIEKDVNVFDTERGGAGQKKPPETFGDSPLRSFVRQEEQAVSRLRLSAADRRLLKDYWDAIRAGR